MKFQLLLSAAAALVATSTARVPHEIMSKGLQDCKPLPPPPAAAAPPMPTLFFKVNDVAAGDCSGAAGDAGAFGQPLGLCGAAGSGNPVRFCTVHWCRANGFNEARCKQDIAARMEEKRPPNEEELRALASPANLMGSCYLCP